MLKRCRRLKNTLSRVFLVSKASGGFRLFTDFSNRTTFPAPVVDVDISCCPTAVFAKVTAGVCKSHIQVDSLFNSFPFSWDRFRKASECDCISNGLSVTGPRTSDFHCAFRALSYSSFCVLCYVVEQIVFLFL